MDMPLHGKMMMINLMILICIQIKIPMKIIHGDFYASGGNRTPDNPAPETGALSTELQMRQQLI